MKFSTCVIFIFFTFLILVSQGNDVVAQKAHRKIPDSWKLGTATCLTGQLTRSIMEEVKKSGIEYLEIGWNSDKMLAVGPEDRLAYARRVYRDAKDLDLILWSAHLPYGTEYDISEPDDLKRKIILKTVKEYVDLSFEMGLKYMVIHPSEAFEEVERPQRIKASRESLKELAHYIKGKEVALSIECLPPNFLGNSSAEILAILDGIDEVGICYDSNHLFPEKAEDFIKAVGKRIRTIHISDYDGVNQKHWLPGQGVLNWNKVINGLIDAGYSGPFMYEVVRRENEAHTFKDLKGNYDSLKNAWADQ